MTTTTSRVQVGIEPVAGNIGAELTGVDIGDELDDDVIAQIRAALLEHKVVYLRDQHLDYERQVAFAQRFGTVTLGHPTLPSPADQRHLEEIDSAKGSRANFWHTDVTFLDRPVAFTFLHGIIMPAVGGDTVWANTAVAYRSLPAELRAFVDTLRVVHTNTPNGARRGDPTVKDPVMAEHHRLFESTLFRTEHPMVRVHPETSERALLLGGFAQSVVGLGVQGSRDLIRMLQDFVTRPENTVRWRWRAGDVAIWDNRATQHFAIADYGDARRRGERVTVAGEVPVGVDGRPSVSIEGEAANFYAGEARTDP